MSSGLIATEFHATTADEWFASFIERLEADPRRKRTAISELYRPLPTSVRRARAYDAQTDRLLAEHHERTFQ